MITKLLTNLFLSRIKLPRDIHRFAFRKYPDRTFVQLPDTTITYRQLQDRSYRLAQALEAAGLKPGDGIFVRVDTGPEFFEIRTAALESGIVQTPFHALHTPEFTTYAFGEAKPKLFIVDKAFDNGSIEALQAIAPDLPIWIIGENGEYERQIASHAPKQSSVNFPASNTMVLGFTSGTTGTPKGLLSSHKAAVDSLKLLIKNLELKRDKKAVNIGLTSIPLVGAGSGLIFPTFLSGGTLVLMDKYSPENLIRTVKKFGVTRLFITPSHLIDLLDMPESVDVELKTVSHIIYGTANTPAAKLEEAIARFGPIFQQGYGQAEILPPVSLLPSAMHMKDGKIAPRSVLQSCGKVVEGVDVRISDPDGRRLPDGEIGEIHVLTPTRLTTYLDPAKNEGVILPDGYFVSGDHGYINADGFLHVVDREADTIKTEHGTIFPRLIEEEAHDHPAVKECVVIAIDGKPVLFASLREKYKDANHKTISAEINSLLDQRIEPWKMPQTIQILDAMPRSFLGKVMRRNVWEKIINGTD